MTRGMTGYVLVFFFVIVKINRSFGFVLEEKAMATAIFTTAATTSAAAIGPTEHANIIVV